MNAKFVVVLASALLAYSSAALSQDEPDDAAVWRVIEAQWEATQKGDEDWIDDLLIDDFVGWGGSSPAPQTKDSVQLWRKFEAKLWDGETHELYPLSIVIHNDTAVAHYLYMMGGESADGSLKTISGRYTDVLVRQNGEWKFLAWAGGSTSSDD